MFLRSNRFLLLCLAYMGHEGLGDEVCQISACQALDRMRQDSDFTQLEFINRRLRSLEQSVWRIDNGVERWYRCCEGPCRCRPETSSISCWNKNHLELPFRQVVPKDVKSIDLAINKISALNKNTFSGLNKMNELDLSENAFDYLPPLLFEDLESLEHLRLQKNRLEQMEGKLFHRLSHLHTLDLSSNRLRGVPGDMLLGCRKLTSLSLASNLIEILPENLVQGLSDIEDLDLSSNQLHDLRTACFNGLTALRRLMLNDNRIASLPMGVFKDLANLDVLCLKKNRLTFLKPNVFNSLKRLTFLDLTNNWISTLRGDEFKGLSNVIEMYLGQNYLTELPDAAFDGMDSLQQLYLYGNNIKRIDRGVFTGLDNLTTLMLNSNLLDDLDELAFEPLANLKKLHLDSNKLYRMPQDIMNYTSSLATVKLTKNPWHCDCAMIYLATWVSENLDRVADSVPSCLSPEELAGRPIDSITYRDICLIQWSSFDNTPLERIKSNTNSKVILRRIIHKKDETQKKKTDYENISPLKASGIKMYKNSTHCISSMGLNTTCQKTKTNRRSRLKRNANSNNKKVISNSANKNHLDWDHLRENNGPVSKRKRKRIYSKWSKWEKCSRTCMTQRHRWCKVPRHCGNEIISQAAYCFTEGGTCKAWIQDMMAQGWDFSNTVRTIARGDYKEQRAKVTVGRNPQSELECGLANNTVSNWDLRKIIGGRPSRPGQWPWQVALLNRFKEVFCGGTLISSEWILTAAHCVQRPLYARFGEFNLAVREGTERTLRIREVVIHPDYNADLVDSDIALLRVEGMKTRLPPACLPEPGSFGRHGHFRRKCTIIGWGKTNPNHISGSYLLHQAQIPIVSRSICKSVYKEHKITGNMLCAGFKHGRKDSCLGDSGGPLLCKDNLGRWSVQGITSFGEGCGRKAKYGIYTKVSNYILWIKQVVSSYGLNGVS